MATFNPTWRTNLGLLATLTNNETFQYNLQCEDVAAITATDGQTTIPLASSLIISNVKVNGISVPFSINNGKIVLTTPLIVGQYVEVIRNTTIVYSILTGSLPPGLSLSYNGIISGTLGNVPGTTPITYTVIIRATDGTNYRDRQFSIIGTPGSYVPQWIPTGTPVTDQVLGISYYDLGTVQRGAAFNYSFDATDSSGSIPPASYEAIPSLNTTYNGILPSGLSFNGTTRMIEGVVNGGATPGSYFFALYFPSVPSANSIYLHILVLTTIETQTSPPIVIDWITPSGLLGEVIERQPCYFYVNAIVTVGPTISYSVSNGSLPPGLSIDTSSGFIVGQPTNVPRDETYTFTIRATSGTAFIDRTFSINAKASALLSNGMEVNLRFPALIKNDIFGAYSTSIPKSMLYRASDSNFGLVADPKIYIIGGLNIGDLSTALQNYQGIVSLLLDSLSYAIVKDSSGNIIYEVLYRIFIDPQEQAGGFIANPSVSTDTIVYPHSKGSVNYVYPNSIKNVRYDLVSAIGLSTIDPSYEYIPGLDGYEPMPAWMRSIQINNSALGYIIAAPIAFLTPGSSAVLLSTLSLPSTAPEGKIITFNRYTITTTTVTNNISSSIDSYYLLTSQSALQ